MTLSHSAMTNKSDLRPSELMQHSSKISPKSSTGDRRDEFKLKLKTQNQNLISSTISSLNGSRVEILSYAETIDYQTANKTWLLGKFLNVNWHVPQFLTEDMLQLAIDAVKPVYQDNELGVKQALIELYLVTGHERLGDSEREKMLTLYHSKLSEHSPAAVRIVLSEMMDSKTWWPSWADIQLQLSPYSSDLLRLHQSLKGIARKEQKRG